MKRQIILFGAGFVLLICGSVVFAEWGPSTPVTEINTAYIEGTTFLSSDGLTLYYSRMDTDTFYYHRIYQATRSTTSGPFTQVSEISTLNGSSHVSAPWVSPDNLRMYYETTAGGWKINYTSRASVSDPWMPGAGVSSINAYGSITSVSLSADECIALFATYNNNTWAAYLATRSDRNSAFTNFSAFTAMPNAAAADPFLTADGLTAYCVMGAQLYKSTRATTGDAFGTAAMISGFDNIRYPTLSVDGMTMYWTREYVQSGKIISDVYVSHYIPEPCTMVLLGLGGLLLRSRR